MLVQGPEERLDGRQLNVTGSASLVASELHQSRQDVGVDELLLVVSMTSGQSTDRCRQDGQERVRGVSAVIKSDERPECVRRPAERCPHRRVVVDRLAHRVYDLQRR